MNHKLMTIFQAIYHRKEYPLLKKLQTALNFY